MLRAAILVAWLVLGPVAPARASTMTVSKTYPPGGATAIRVEFPAGDLVLSGSDDRDILVTMTARCRHSGSSCAERARRVRLPWIQAPSRPWF